MLYFDFIFLTDFLKKVLSLKLKRKSYLTLWSLSFYVSLSLCQMPPCPWWPPPHERWGWLCRWWRTDTRFLTCKKDTWHVQACVDAIRQFCITKEGWSLDKTGTLLLYIRSAPLFCWCGLSGTTNANSRGLPWSTYLSDAAGHASYFLLFLFQVFLSKWHSIYFGTRAALINETPGASLLAGAASWPGAWTTSSWCGGAIAPLSAPPGCSGAPHSVQPPHGGNSFWSVMFVIMTIFWPWVLRLTDNLFLSNPMTRFSSLFTFLF